MTGLEDHKDKYSEDRDKRDWTTSQPARKTKAWSSVTAGWQRVMRSKRKALIGLNNRGETVDPREDSNGAGNEHMKCGRGFHLQDVNEFL